MISIKTELDDKKIEANTMLEFISEASTLKASVLRVSILKSAYILILYSMIESISTLILVKLHEIIATEQYANLRVELKILWVDFFFKKSSEKNYQEHLDKIINNDILFPSLEDFSKKITLFSGNLDGRAIDKLLKKYGIGYLRTSDRDKLIIIKDKRNKLAHGEEMFKESCRNMTISELEILQTATFSALDSIVIQVDKYIDEKNYLTK